MELGQDFRKEAGLQGERGNEIVFRFFLKQMSSTSKQIVRPVSRHRWFNIAALRIGAMLLLFTSAGVFEASHLSALTVSDRTDSWWHLQTGLWILENHDTPRNVLFSQTPGLPSYPSSWGYDLLIGCAFGALDVRAFPAMLVVFKLAVAVVTFLLAGGLRGTLWWAVVLSATVQ